MPTPAAVRTIKRLPFYVRLPRRYYRHPAGSSLYVHLCSKLLKIMFSTYRDDLADTLTFINHLAFDSILSGWLYGSLEYINS